MTARPSFGMAAVAPRGFLSRARLARQQVADLDVPALATDAAGTILAFNAAMAALSAGMARRDDPVEELFAAILSGAPAPALYRAAQGARASGFAVLPVVLARSAEPRHLVVRASGLDALIWSLSPQSLLLDMVADDGASPYTVAPFVHLRLSGTSLIAANPAFHMRFGREGLPGILRAAETGGRSGDRVLLRETDGTVATYRCFVYERSDPGQKDVLLFHVPGDSAARSGATQVLERVPVPLAQFELDGTLLWCNSRAREIFDAAAVPGAPFSSLVEPLGVPLEQILAEAAEGAAPPGSGEMVRLRGAETSLQIVLTRVRIYERETLLAVISDASQLRALEDQFAQSQKMEAVGKLAGGVAHDFNNVLTAIVGHCDLLLLRKDVSHPDYADLMQIAQNANRAATLVRQLLAFSRKQTLKPETLSVQDVVSETHYLLDRLVGEAVRIRLDFGPELWPVRADQQQLEQVLMNLVVNARDAMEGTGLVTIGARNRRLPRHGGKAGPLAEFVEIEVRDTGPGIDPALIDKVFDPFFTTKAKGEGTGLGLSTVYGIVSQSGGHVLAANAEGGGAVFTVRLPRADESKAEAAADQDHPPPVQPPPDLTGSGAVLLVEDEAPVRAFAARALKLRGYEVAAAETAEEGMELLSDPDFRVDVIVSDVVMPGMDGPTFATEARKLRPGVRLILVSGYAEESFRRNLTENDFLFLPKPFSLNALTAAVKEALGAPDTDGT